MTTRILYNADCPICNAEICHYQRYAGARDIPFGFDDLNTVDPATYGVTADQAARRLHVLHDGQVIAGVDAFVVIWRLMPRYRHLAWVVSRPFILQLSRMVYDRILAPILYRMHLRRLAKAAD